MLNNQRGNALFLILIAVILFAALSYAVTQSNRSGGNASRETNLVASTTVTQYPEAVATAIMRMMLRGVTVDELDFTSPSMGGFDNDPVTAKVFHPNGGGAVWQNVDPNTVELDTNNAPMGQWSFLKQAISDLGTSDLDFIALLTYVRKGICEHINEQITGSKDIPDNVNGTSMNDISSGGIMGGANKVGHPGRQFLCEKTVDGYYYYYHVLVEQ